MKNITIKSLRDKQNETTEEKADFFNKPPKKDSELEDLPYKPRKTKFLFKTVCLSLFIFIVGGIGGITIDRVALPYLLFKYPDLTRYHFFQRVYEGTTTIRETIEINISEDEAVIEAIEKVSPSVVEIFEFSNEGTKLFYKGAGIILTNDGYIITSIANITPKETESDNEKTNIIKIKLKDGNIFEAELIKIDLSLGLAIIKIPKKDLSVIAFSNSDNLRLGEKVIIIDSAIVTDIVSKLVDDFIVETTAEKSYIQKRVKIVDSLKSSFNGAPVVNTKGEIIGISQGGNIFIPTNEVMNFTNNMTEKNK
ncbi:S1C family serine protease [Patescibacteria group bacterium]|nr:S1C family serine protease [Patescibacteria group bacterium]